MQLPMFFQANDVPYHLRGMPFHAATTVGMSLIAVGGRLVVHGLFPRHSS